jgi:RND family efflux transporter MFP subunit
VTTIVWRVIALAVLSAAIIGTGIGAARGLRAFIDATAESGEGEVPTTTVRRDDVAIAVTTRGELQGGGSVPLMAPRTGAAELPITFLRGTGELVKAGDVVAEFDSSGQQNDLLEAEADLEEARQQLIKAEAEARVALERARLQVSTTEADLRVAELDQRDNDFVGAVQRRQNEIALARARNRHEQAVEALAHREATGGGIETQRAAVREAQAKADTARKTMAGMTLRAPASGYVELAPNTSGLTVIYSGMQIPTYQLGDIARPGQTIAAIPDMSSWEVNTQIPETDRAFLAVGQPATIRPKAMPGREFRGRVSLLGGSAGSAWNRTFNCRIALVEADEALRPGMSVDVVIDVETLEDVLWVPSQAVFEREGRRFVYRQTPEGFITHDVTLVRRTESQAIVTGIDAGARIALAEPGQRTAPGPSNGPLGALPK